MGEVKQTGRWLTHRATYILPTGRVNARPAVIGCAFLAALNAPGIQFKVVLPQYGTCSVGVYDQYNPMVCS